MKKIQLSLILLLLAMNSFSQKGFGIDGSFGLGYNNGDLTYPILLEGQIQFNDYLSVNLGLGLWNSGFKYNEKKDATGSSTLYLLSSNKTLPSLQFGSKGQIPIFNYKKRQFRLFAEPKLYFLPFSAQTVTIKEIYYNLKTDEESGKKTYTPTGNSDKTSMKSESNPRLYGGLQVGLSFELIDNVDLAISYEYTNMDLFKDLRGQNIKDSNSNEWSLDKYIPTHTDLQLIKVGFLFNFDLN
jgi:hypothetical protein